MDLGIGTSFRSNNGSFRMDGFSRSSLREEDEEALKWAAIEKLPTFKRLRKGLVTSLNGEANEVDILNLGFQVRKNLIDRLLQVAEQDNEKLLFKLQNRLDRYFSLFPLFSLFNLTPSQQTQGDFETFTNDRR